MKPTALILLLLFSVSCATVPTTHPGLEVAIEHLSAPTVQLIESRAVAKFRIDNETADPIEILGGVHRIRINGKRIGKVMDGETITVPPYGSVVREVPLMLANLAVIRSISQTIDTKHADYQLDSRLTVVTPTGRRTVSLRRDGDVSLEELVPKPDAAPLVPQPVSPGIVAPAPITTQ